MSERQSLGTGNRARRPKAFHAAFCSYLRTLSALLTVPSRSGPRRLSSSVRYQGPANQCASGMDGAQSHQWLERAATEHDSDLASRRRERMAKEMERAQDDMFTLARAALAKVAERIQGMDARGFGGGPGTGGAAECCLSWS